MAMIKYMKYRLTLTLLDKTINKGITRHFEGEKIERLAHLLSWEMITELLNSFESHE